MNTILVEALIFIGESAAGGLTWDIMKEAGSKILDTFKKHFTNAKYFKDENEAEQFLKDISTKESLNKRKPLEDIWNVYYNCTDKEASDLFKTEIVNWIKKYGEDLAHLGVDDGSKKGVFIQKQVVKGHAQVTNIGNQNVYYRGTGDENKLSDK